MNHKDPIAQNDSFAMLIDGKEQTGSTAFFQFIPYKGDRFFKLSKDAF